jgi:hypothetical protein
VALLEEERHGIRYVRSSDRRTNWFFSTNVVEAKPNSVDVKSVSSTFEIL